ncbi:RES family NAD+ phosphorylase [Sphingomonas sanguinis]|uniref:RES family NAD+ phosphorylase n=1 Tax=Sphingomonas sanguinis TaxID=33051 RepID=A0ABU5LVB9_9SPHN|nr:RES family NAD+ phosphorylase [Sphingomonas sanguinis]MDZ7283661.1 RES family NAD+ phosphorylase [Sphingomonas sanguinis]QXT35027.1 RES family NAD+ phosphorylase [Sphingomonas sanguinis]
MATMLPMMNFDGPVWRLLPQAGLADPAAPARAPEGRFHHDGQIAAYASLTAEGAGVAIRRYLGDGVARVLIPMRLTAQCVADARGLVSASVVWQDVTAVKGISPTWAISDMARQAGAQAMLYSSRSRPDLSHVVVFGPECLHSFGEATAYVP